MFYSDEYVKDEIKKQIQGLSYVHSSFFTNEPAEKLAKRLASYAPKDLNRVYLVSGGSEAMEASIKLVRQYFLEIGKPQRRHISIMGIHLALSLLVVTNSQFEPLLFETSLISPCYSWRDQKEHESEERIWSELIN